MEVFITSLYSGTGAEYITHIPDPLCFASSVKACRRMGTRPRSQKTQVHRNSEVRRSAVRCTVWCCIKSVKSVFRVGARRAGAMRGVL